MFSRLLQSLRRVGLVLRTVATADRTYALAAGILFVSNAYAGILGQKACTVYNNLFDNQFFGAAGMFAFTLLFLKWKFSDNSGEAIGTGFKIALALTALVSLGTILGWFGVSPC